MMKKLIVILFILLFLSFVFYSINYVDNGTIDYSKESVEYNTKIRELKIEKEKLIEALDRYDNKKINVPNMGSVIFLFTDTNRKHLDDAISILDDNEYVGVFALSQDHVPEDNDSDYLNREEIDSLVEKGYELVIKLKTNENANEAYSLFSDKGYNIKGFYLPDKIISIETIKAIKEIGDMVIFGSFGEYEDDEIMLIEKYENHYSNVKNNFFDSIEDSKTIAISVGYDDKNKDENYEYVNFTSMINIINPYVDDNNTDICNITCAIERHNAYLEQLESINNEDMKEIKELKDKIEEIDKKIIEIGG